MNYNTKPLKIITPNAEVNNQIQANNISLQQWIQNINKINTTQPKNQILSNINWNTDWVTMDTNILWPSVIWKSWIIPIGEINHLWIPRFSIDMIFRNGTMEDNEWKQKDSTGFQIGFSNNFKKFIGWDVKDITGIETSNIKTISLIASVWIDFEYVDIDPIIFQTKLIVKYVNQSILD